MKKLILCTCFILLLVTGCQSTESNVEVGKIEKSNEINDMEVENSTNKEDTLIDDESIEIDLGHTKVIEDVLNVREHATTESTIIGKVFKNGVYQILSEETISNNDKEEVWYKISINDNVGWIAGWFCEVTDDDLSDYNTRMDNLEIGIQSSYSQGDIIDFNELIEWSDFDISFKTDDQISEVTNLLTIESSGKLIVTLNDSLNRERIISRDIRVINEDMYTKALYKSMDLDSKVIAFEKDIDLTYDKDSQAFLSIEDGKLLGWYKAKYKGQTCYYYNYDYYHANASIKINKFNFTLDNGQVLSLDSKGYINKKLTSKGLIILDEFYYKNTLVNLKTGQVYYLNNMILSDDMNYILNYQAFYDDLEYKETSERLVELYLITEDDIKLIYQEKVNNLGVDNIHIKGDTISYSLNYSRLNEWKSTSKTSYKENYELVVDTDTKTATRVLLNENVEHINSIDEDEIIVVYSQMDEKSNVLGNYKLSEIKTIEFARTLDSIDKVLCNWYNITLDNGQEGFAYRKRVEADGERLSMRENMDIILNNGETMEYIAHKLVTTSTYVRDALVFKDIIVFNSYYEGVGLTFISLDDGERINLEMQGEIFISNDNKYLINLEQEYYEYYEYGSYLTLYKINDQGFDEILKIETKGYRIYHDKWTNNDYQFEIQVAAENKSSVSELEKEYVTMKKVDGKWVLEGENLYDLEIILSQ